MKSLVLLLVVLCCLSGIENKVIYEGIAQVVNLGAKNFDKQITMMRENTISMVHFYKFGGT